MRLALHPMSASATSSEVPKPEGFAAVGDKPEIVTVRNRETGEEFTTWAADVTPDLEFVDDDERLALIRSIDARYDAAEGFDWRSDERRFLLRLLDATAR